MPAEDLRLYAAWAKTDDSVPDVPCTFINTSGGLEITGYTGKAYSVEIPAQINGQDVVAIGDYAFANNKAMSMGLHMY